MKSFILTFYMFLILNAISAQDSIKVRFLVKGSETFYIKLNEELLPINNTQTIEKGTYQLEIYSPKYQLYTATFTTPDQPYLEYVAELKLDPDYRVYLAEYNDYKSKLAKRQALPGVAGGLGIVAAPLLYFRTKKIHESYIKTDFMSKFLPQDQATAELKRKYIINQTAFITASTMAIGGTLVYFLLKKGTNKIPKPVYKQQNPFTLEYFEMSYNENYNLPQGRVVFTF